MAQELTILTSDTLYSAYEDIWDVVNSWTQYIENLTDSTLTTVDVDYEFDLLKSLSNLKKRLEITLYTSDTPDLAIIQPIGPETLGTLITDLRVKGFTGQTRSLEFRDLEFWHQLNNEYNRAIFINIGTQVDIEPVDYDRGLQYVEESERESGGVSRIAEPRDVQFSGSRVVYVRETDTLQTLASQYLGDDTLWPYISQLNGIENNSVLVSGDEIFIPIFAGSATTFVKDSYFFDTNLVKNAYGVDLHLTEDGDLEFNKANDLSIVGGVDNALQAINIKLNSAVGSALKHTSLGLSAQAGVANTAIAENYVKMHLRATVLQDPRVASVDNVVLRNRGSIVVAHLFIRLVGFDEVQALEAVL